MSGGNSSSEVQDHQRDALVSSPLDQGNNTLTPPPRKSSEYKRWTKEEHKSFLKGLQECGKGDWKNISRNFVETKTPSQVASHAQKYFLRQASDKRGKRRSIHDITLPDPVVSSEGSLIQRPPSLSTSPSDPGNNTLPPLPRKSREYRKWTGNEKMLFLEGLQEYGKGDWKNISKHVKTRTPSQVCSHAQKYIRGQASDNRGERSIHDITLEDPVPRRIDHQNLVPSPNIDLRHLHGCIL